MSRPFGSRAAELGYKSVTDLTVHEFLKLLRDDKIIAGEVGLGGTGTWGDKVRGKQGLNPSENDIKYFQGITRNKLAMARDVYGYSPIVGSVSPVLDTSGREDQFIESIHEGIYVPQMQEFREANVKIVMGEAFRDAKTDALAVLKAMIKTDIKGPDAHLIVSFEPTRTNGMLPAEDISWKNALDRLRQQSHGEVNIHFGLNCVGSKTIEEILRALGEEASEVFTSTHPNAANTHPSCEISQRFSDLCAKGANRTQPEQEEFERIKTVMNSPATDIGALAEQAFRIMPIFGVCCGATQAQYQAAVDAARKARKKAA